MLLGADIYRYVLSSVAEWGNHILGQVIGTLLAEKVSRTRDPFACPIPGFKEIVRAGTNNSRLGSFVSDSM
jgi:hypothetical protein